VLAPLAGGPSTPELAAAVSNAGGLGFLAAGYLTRDVLSEQLARTRELTHEPLGVNVFVLEEVAVDEEAIAAYAHALEPEARARGVRLGVPRFDDDWLPEKLEVMCKPTWTSSRRRSAGLAAATGRAAPGKRHARLGDGHLAHEARAAQAEGVDALIVQGGEAGGHRGAWSDDGEPTPLYELLASVDVGLPLIATGGLADRDGRQSSTRRRRTGGPNRNRVSPLPEAGTSEPHRRALRAGGETAFTRAFTPAAPRAGSSTAS